MAPFRVRHGRDQGSWTIANLFLAKLLCIHYTLLYTVPYNIQFFCIKSWYPEQDQMGFFIIPKEVSFVYIFPCPWEWHACARVYSLRRNHVKMHQIGFLQLACV